METISQDVEVNPPSTVFIKHSMCEKKGHEVEVMSEACHKVAKLCHVDNVSACPIYSLSLRLLHDIEAVNITSVHL